MHVLQKALATVKTSLLKHIKECILMFCFY